MYTDLALFIDGKWVNGNGRKGEEVLNPATEKPLAHLPHASKADLDEASRRRRKGLHCGAQPLPMTAPRSCARLPISCASATMRSPKFSCRSKAKYMSKLVPRW